MNVSSLIELKKNPNIPEITSGDTVKVSIRVVEGDKERIQVFQGVIIKLRNRGAASSFTVRRVSYGVGVERTFPFYSPRVEKVELVRRGRRRRAKLYYLRGLSAKTSRLKERRLSPREQELERQEAIQRKEALELAQAEARAAKLAEQQAAEAAAAEEPAAEAEVAVEEASAEAEQETPETVEEPGMVAESEPEAQQEPAAEPEEENKE